MRYIGLLYVSYRMALDIMISGTEGINKKEMVNASKTTFYIFESNTILCFVIFFAVP